MQIIVVHPSGLSIIFPRAGTIGHWPKIHVYVMQIYFWLEISLLQAKILSALSVDFCPHPVEQGHNTADDGSRAEET